MLLAAGRTAAAAAADGPAQAGDPTPPQLQETARVRLVLLPTTVTTPGGRPVRDLGRDDFEVLDRGTPQEIGVFATEEDSPIALAFLLDLSASMGLRGQLDEAKRAIRRFVEPLDPDDLAGLIGFADEQVTWISDFTTNRERFLARLGVQSPGGRTALYDALAASPRLVDQRIRGRRALVLITDGLDNASRLPQLQAVWLARQVQVPIYVLSFIPLRLEVLPRRVRDGLAVLRRFADETGGALLPIHDGTDVDRAVARVRSELRFQYLLGYYPGHGEWDGTFRRVEVRTDRDHVRVRARRGYYASP